MYFSPQKTEPFKDTDGSILENSIAELIDIDINGTKQRLLIRGKNINNPVLLHLHGGPGSPDHPFMKRDNFVLEDIFTICYWEQRGSGASYNKNIPVNSMTLGQIVDDGIKVTKYLQNKFNKEKIYIQGHSWGTTVGTSMVQKSPELFYAYFGVGQMANTKLSEQLSYDFTVQEAKKANDKKAIEQLKKIGSPPYKSDSDWLNAVFVERPLMRKYQDAKINRNESLFKIYKAFIFYPEYSISDKLNALKGDPFSMKYLWKEAIHINLFKSIPEYKIPIYIFQGKYDKTTATSVSKKYFEFLKAPKKQYFEFEKSAHSPQLEEFKEYRSIIKSILSKEQLVTFQEKNKTLSTLIDSLYLVDQKVQNDVVEAFQNGISGDSIKTLFAKIPHVFKRHIPILKKIIKDYGYPVPELVGKESSHHFFMMIQHSDADVDFQTKMLKTIEKEAIKGNIEKDDYAHLLDRVLLAKGEQQLYGTQVEYDTINNQKAIPKNLYKPEECNERRAKLGIETLEDYLKLVDKTHKKQN
jgi:pimeloyl-ACP methyl ester carboxylesterase